MPSCFALHLVLFQTAPMGFAYVVWGVGSALHNSSRRAVAFRLLIGFICLGVAYYASTFYPTCVR